MKRILVKFHRRLSFALCLCLLSACSVTESSAPSQVGVTGGLAGTLIGAGTGAIAGAVLEDGLVAESAMLGAGVGLAAGAVVGAGYQHYRQVSEVSSGNVEIRELDSIITENDAEIESLREELDDDTRAVEVRPNGGARLYQGASTGNPYR